MKADFRTIAATNKDLEAAMEAGEFRKDLFYRLNVFVIDIPPLTDRRSDIPMLANHFLNTFSSQMNKSISKISQEAMKQMVDYDWPGNVRELENAIERAVVICKSDEIQPNDLPFSHGRAEEESTDDSLEALQVKHIKKILEQTVWNISKAALVLQIDRVTLYNKINKYNLKKP